ncbi:M23 family metallopeptidase [Paramagnetospirillum kuznetsovii]|nr:M23 family metallopeptidase [Paramagnetospirillum kuznetsovii]
MGHVPPDSGVSIDGRPVPVDSGGAFLLGFGRDAAPAAILEIRRGVTIEAHPLVIARRDWPVQRIEGLPRDKAEPDPVAVARIKTEADLLRALRAKVSGEALFLTGLSRPATGIVSGVFGSQRVYNGNAGAPHSGLDIAAAKGEPVRAAADGVVVLAAPDLFLTGQTVMIDHGLGLMSSYAHLSRLDVAPGRKVGRGEVIGAIGATGLATGAHLHWGMSWLEVRIDPASALDLLGESGSSLIPTKQKAQKE